MRKWLFLFLAVLPLPAYAAVYFQDLLNAFGVVFTDVGTVLTALAGAVVGVGLTAAAIFFAMRFLEWARKIA